MKNGICRNCRKQSVFRKKADQDYTIPIRSFSVAAVYHFVCANCGYIENYILDDGKLRQIANNWEYVLPYDEPSPYEDDEGSAWTPPPPEPDDVRREDETDEHEQIP